MKNKRLALKLLAKDCEIAGFYVQGKKTCAVGCLALASGASQRTLRKWNGKPISVNELYGVRLKLMAKFDLSNVQLCRIQEANDHYDHVADRRKAVLGVVRAIN